MKKHSLLLPLLLLTAGMVPAASAQDLQPVAARDLNKFVGTTVHGRAYANLGVVGPVDNQAGVIGLWGPDGEYALIHTSVLARNGLRLHAPTLTIADIRRASDSNLQHRGATLINPQVQIEEPPYYAAPE